MPDLRPPTIGVMRNAPRQKNRTGPARGPFLITPSPGYAENDVPQPQLDLALGLTNVKPPVSPCCT